MLFATADWHLDHNRIITYCRRLDFMSPAERSLFLEREEAHQKGEVGYEELRRIRYGRETVERMNSAIIDGVNAVVTRNDELIIAGDLFFGQFSRFVDFRSRIRCQNIHVVWGNHDKRLRREKVVPALFKSAQDILFHHCNGCEYWVSHFANLVWHKSHRGSRNLHGHSHGTLQEFIDNTLKIKSLDVGVDYRARLGFGYTPWPIDQVERYFGKMPLKDQ